MRAYKERHERKQPKRDYVPYVQRSIDVSLVNSETSLGRMGPVKSLLSVGIAANAVRKTLDMKGTAGEPKSSNTNQ